MKAAIKREQCQACLNIAKREQARCETSKIKNERLKISLTSYFLPLTSYLLLLASKQCLHPVRAVRTASPNRSDSVSGLFGRPARAVLIAAVQGILLLSVRCKDSNLL